MKKSDRDLRVVDILVDLRFVAVEMETESASASESSKKQAHIVHSNCSESRRSIKHSTCVIDIK